MYIYESNSAVMWSGALSIFLILCGCVMIYFYGVNNIDIVAIIVGIICLFFSLKKYLQKNFLHIEDDKLTIKNAGEEMIIKYSELSKVYIKTVQEKKNVQMLVFEFKKANQNIDAAHPGIIFFNNKEAILHKEFQKSVYEICNILKEKLTKIALKN